MQQVKLDKETKERIILYISAAFIIVLFGVYLRIRIIKNKVEKEALLQEIRLLKAEKLLNDPSSDAFLKEKTELNRSNIESSIGTPLNESDWNILISLYDNPIIVNRAIAEEISLSVDGVKSSLKKMYKLFGINNSSDNKRFSLVIKATKLSHKPQN